MQRQERRDEEVACEFKKRGDDRGKEVLARRDTS